MRLCRGPLAASRCRTAGVAVMLLVAHGARDDHCSFSECGNLRVFTTVSTTSNDGDDASAFAERPVITADIQVLAQFNVL